MHTLFFVSMRTSVKVLLFLAVFVSCSKEKDEIPYFELSESSLSFAWNGGSHSLSVHTNTEWQILSELPSWIDVQVVSNSKVDITLQENEDFHTRNYNLIFSAADQSFLLKIEQMAKETLLFDGLKEYEVSPEGGNLKVKLIHNVPYVLKYLDDGSDAWIRQVDDGVLGGFIDSIILFSIDANLSSDERKARIVILNEEYMLSDTLSVLQYGGGMGKYSDMEYVMKQQALDGKANLVVMGDGFLATSLRKDGEYERAIDDAIEHFFSIEPYKTYRDYFNVYMVAAESEEEGVGEKSLFGGGSINNKFGTAYGRGTEIVCNDELIFEYARKVKELPEDKPITVLVVLNSDKYAGTAYLYPDGNSIALCPMSTEEPPNDFEGIVHHEAGGHAFGFLLDEYVYNEEEMPEERKAEIREWQKMGYQMNLDFTDDLDKILWKDFIGIDKYAPVGAYEGGYEYQYGVWRSEENSCMNNNIPYYNVQSRWSIVKRIMDLSEMEFSVQDFIKNDFPEYPADSRALNAWEGFVPLATPVWVTN